MDDSKKKKRTRKRQTGRTVNDLVRQSETILHQRRLGKPLASALEEASEQAKFRSIASSRPSELFGRSKESSEWSGAIGGEQESKGRLRDALKERKWRRRKLPEQKSPETVAESSLLERGSPTKLHGESSLESLGENQFDDGGMLAMNSASMVWDESTVVDVEGGANAYFIDTQASAPEIPQEYSHDDDAAASTDSEQSEKSPPPPPPKRRLAPPRVAPLPVSKSPTVIGGARTSVIAPPPLQGGGSYRAHAPQKLPLAISIPSPSDPSAAWDRLPISSRDTSARDTSSSREKSRKREEAVIRTPARNPAIRTHRSKVLGREADAFEAHSEASKVRDKAREDAESVRSSRLSSRSSEADSTSLYHTISISERVAHIPPKDYRRKKGLLLLATETLRAAGTYAVYSHDLRRGSMIDVMKQELAVRRQQAVHRLATHARKRAVAIQAGQAELFSKTDRAQLYYGMMVAFQSLDGNFLCVDRDSGQVYVREPEKNWEHRGIAPFNVHASAAAPSAPLIEPPFFLFRVVDLRRLFFRGPVRAGDPVWLAVVPGTGEHGWKDGAVLGAHLHRPVALDGKAADPLHAEHMQLLLDQAPGVVPVAGTGARESAALRGRVRDISRRGGDASSLVPKPGPRNDEWTPAHLRNSSKHTSIHTTRAMQARDGSGLEIPKRLAGGRGHDRREALKRAEEELRDAVTQATKTGSALREASKAYRKVQPAELVGDRMGAPLPIRAFVPLSHADARVQADYATVSNVRGWYGPADNEWERIVAEKNRIVRFVGQWRVQMAKKVRLKDGLVLGALGPERQAAYNGPRSAESLMNGEGDDEPSKDADEPNNNSSPPNRPNASKSPSSRSPTSKVEKDPALVQTERDVLCNQDLVYLSQDLFYLSAEAGRVTRHHESHAKSRPPQNKSASKSSDPPISPSPSRAGSRLPSPSSKGLSPAASPTALRSLYGDSAEKDEDDERSISNENPDEAGGDKDGKGKQAVIQRETELNPHAVKSVLSRQTAAPATLMQFSSGVHSPFQVETRGVFRLLVVLGSEVGGRKTDGGIEEKRPSSRHTERTQTPQTASTSTRNAPPSKQSSTKPRQETQGEEQERIKELRARLLRIPKKTETPTEFRARAQLSKSERQRSGGHKVLATDHAGKTAQKLSVKPDKTKSGKDSEDDKEDDVTLVEAIGAEQFTSVIRQERLKAQRRVDEKFLRFEIEKESRRNEFWSQRSSLVDRKLAKLSGEPDPVVLAGLRTRPARDRRRSSVASVTPSERSLAMLTPSTHKEARRRRRESQMEYQKTRAEDNADVWSKADEAEIRTRREWRSYLWSPVHGRAAPPRPGQAGSNAGVNVMLPPKPVWVELEDEAAAVRSRIRAEELDMSRQRQSIFGRLSNVSSPSGSASTPKSHSRRGSHTPLRATSSKPLREQAPLPSKFFPASPDGSSTARQQKAAKEAELTAQINAQREFRRMARENRQSVNTNFLAPIDGPMFGERILLDGQPIAHTLEGRTTEKIMDAVFASFSPSKEAERLAKTAEETEAKRRPATDEERDKLLQQRISATSRRRRSTKLDSSSFDVAEVASSTTSSQRRQSQEDDLDDVSSTTSSSSSTYSVPVSTTTSNPLLSPEQVVERAVERISKQAGLGYGVGGATASALDRADEDGGLHNAKVPAEANLLVHGLRESPLLADSENTGIASARSTHLNDDDAHPIITGRPLTVSKTFLGMLRREDQTMQQLCQVDLEKIRTRRMFRLLLARDVIYDLPEHTDPYDIAEGLDPNEVRAGFRPEKPSDERDLERQLARGRISSVADPSTK